MNMKLEVVVIPVSDGDKAKEFYTMLGWRLGVNFAGEGDFRAAEARHGSSGGEGGGAGVYLERVVAALANLLHETADPSRPVRGDCTAA
jgi:catechol 2,3-dioxygenase-like lactoylglutathione lyase family enzyme